MDKFLAREQIDKGCVSFGISQIILKTYTSKQRYADIFQIVDVGQELADIHLKLPI